MTLWHVTWLCCFTYTAGHIQLHKTGLFIRVTQRSGARIHSTSLYCSISLALSNTCIIDTNGWLQMLPKPVYELLHKLTICLSNKNNQTLKIITQKRKTFEKWNLRRLMCMTGIYCLFHIMTDQDIICSKIYCLRFIQTKDFPSTGSLRNPAILSLNFTWPTVLSKSLLSDLPCFSMASCLYWSLSPCIVNVFLCFNFLILTRCVNLISLFRIW
jgi:hypothetical protein